MDAAGKFDDAVIGLKANGEKTITYHYLQAKHKQDDATLLMSSKFLDTSGGDFSILKYFISYRDIKSHGKFTGSDIGDIVLYTNAGLDHSPKAKAILDFKQILRPVQILNPLLDTSMHTRITEHFKFDFSKATDAREKVYTLLRDASALNQLASIMAELICKDKPFTLKIDIFKTHHIALAKQTIDIKNKCFKQKFLKGTTGNVALKNLLKIFQKKLKEKSGVKFDVLWQELNNIDVTTRKKIKMSSSFGVTVSIKENPKLVSPKDTATAFLNSLSDGNNFILKNARMAGLKNKQLEELAGHVIIKKENDESDLYYFSKKFIKGDKSLKGNLLEFLTNLLKYLKGKGRKINLSEYTIQRKNYHTCLDKSSDDESKNSEDITDDKVTTEEIDNFFKHFVIAVNQPNELDLFAIIKTELGSDFNLLENEFIASLYQKEMLAWLKEKQGRFLTKTEAVELFNKANELLAHYILLGPTLEYAAQVDKSRISFKKPFPIQTLLKSKTKVHNIRCKRSTWLTAIKLHTSLKQLPDYAADDSFIIVRINTAINLQQRLLSAFNSSSDLLIIEIDNELNKSEFTKLLVSTQELLHKHTTKKLFLISTKKTTLIISIPILNIKLSMSKNVALMT